MNRRGFFRAVFGLGVAAVAAPLLPAVVVPAAVPNAALFASLETMPLVYEPLNMYIRRRMRERGFVRKILPPLPLEDK